MLQAKAHCEDRHSVWEPLKIEAFRAFWIAGLFVNTGLFMQDVSAAWLMTTLTQSPLMIALMQTAMTMPFFILALPAGALADLVSRRHLLIFGQLWIMATAALLGFLTLTGLTTPWLLLVLTFMLGVGLAYGAPAWNAMTPELVPKKQLVTAIGLGSAGYNLSRGAGAALGGYIVSQSGPGWVFLTFACCTLVMVWTLWRWQPKERPERAASERMLGAMRAGLRYVRHCPPFLAVLARTVGFAFGSSALWSLIPLLARERMGVDSTMYGIMVSAFGIGTLIGALSLPSMRKRFTLDQSSAIGTIVFACGLAGVAAATHYALGCLALFACGFAWTVKCAALNFSAQLAAPSWVRARALALYLLVFQGFTACGAAVWGTIATYTSMPISMTIAAVQLVITLVGAAWYKLDHAETINLKESSHWSDPYVANENDPHPDEGPVMVTVEYVVDPEKALEFREALSALETQRRRDGAFQWFVFRDVSDESRHVEVFFVESWGEHMLQHERVTEGDRVAEQRVDSFHIGRDRPVVTHYVASRSSSLMAKLVAAAGTSAVKENTP